MSRPWYQTNAGVIVLLVLFFPIGLYFMWEHTDWNKNIKTGLSIVLGLYALILTASLVSQPPTTKKDEPKAAVVAPAPQPEPPKPKYEASLGTYNAIDPATLVVLVNVKNISTVSGAPSCFVNVSNASNTYKGYDTFDPGKTLAPGEEWSFNARLTITKEGAAYVTEGSVGCS